MCHSLELRKSSFLQICILGSVMTHSVRDISHSWNHVSGVCLWIHSLVSRGKSSSAVMQLLQRPLPVCKIWLLLDNRLKKRGEKNREGKKNMQKQLHHICLFPMETRLKPNTLQNEHSIQCQHRREPIQGSVSDRKVTEKLKQQKVFVLHKQKSLIIAHILFSCCIVLWEHNREGRKKRADVTGF